MKPALRTLRGGAIRRRHRPSANRVNTAVSWGVRTLATCRHRLPDAGYGAFGSSEPDDGLTQRQALPLDVVGSQEVSAAPGGNIRLASQTSLMDWVAIRAGWCFVPAPGANEKTPQLRLRGFSIVNRNRFINYFQ